jgi:hypothetical protein
MRRDRKEERDIGEVPNNLIVKNNSAALKIPISTTGNLVLNGVLLLNANKMDMFFLSGWHKNLQ